MRKVNSYEAPDSVSETIANDTFQSYIPLPNGHLSTLWDWVFGQKACAFNGDAIEAPNAILRFARAVAPHDLEEFCAR